ncbi:DUF7940 domain-containing protein [Erythrobacter rubeus]|uniref:Holin n=1 Tax=Erythrobacter rubeus TaxID=2760803 RepID=A0ABR8KUH1_9SPHN|nr:hypothetical protein [Erythrobacter rubeus]MBD2842718.1 hypothetical protein [Erythrobacter rubeus]
MTGFIEKHLVPDWKESWRYASNQFTVAVSAIAGFLVDHVAEFTSLLAFMPRSLQPFGGVGVTLILVILGLGGRLWNQHRDEETKDGQD